MYGVINIVGIIPTKCMVNIADYVNPGCSIQLPFGSP